MALKKHLLVRGKIFLDPSGVSLSGADAYINLEDTEFADGPAKKIEQIKLRNIQDIFRQEGYISFEIYGDIPHKKLTYTVNVLVDLNRDGKASKGDYINMESYPILTFNNPSELIIRVYRIK